MSKIYTKKTIILLVIGIIILSLAGFWLIGNYTEETKPIPEQQENKEIAKIHDLVQKAIETGEKEPLITISGTGFSQDEIKIKAQSFVSFYNSLDKPVNLEFSMFDKTKTLGPGVTSSIKLSESGEIRIGDKILKIYVE